VFGAVGGRRMPFSDNVTVALSINYTKDEVLRSYGGKVMNCQCRFCAVENRGLLAAHSCRVVGAGSRIGR